MHACKSQVAGCVRLGVAFGQEVSMTRSEGVYGCKHRFLNLCKS